MMMRMNNVVLNRTLQRSRNYYDIPTENTVVILTGDFFRKIKTLPIALAKIALDTIHSSYPNLMMTDVILHEATGNVFHPCDRLVCAWADRCGVTIMATQIGKRVKEGEIPMGAAAELSVEEAALLCPPGTRTYRVDSDGSAWFRFRPMEVADLNIPNSRSDMYSVSQSRSSSYQDAISSSDYVRRDGNRLAASVRPSYPDGFRRPSIAKAPSLSDEVSVETRHFRPSHTVAQQSTKRSSIVQLFSRFFSGNKAAPARPRVSLSSLKMAA